MNKDFLAISSSWLCERIMSFITTTKMFWMQPPFQKPKPGDRTGSFGSLAVCRAVWTGCDDRPMALRPRLEVGLPFREHCWIDGRVSFNFEWHVNLNDLLPNCVWVIYHYMKKESKRVVPKAKVSNLIIHTFILRDLCCGIYTPLIHTAHFSQYTRITDAVSGVCDSYPRSSSDLSWRITSAATFFQPVSSLFPTCLCWG